MSGILNKVKDAVTGGHSSTDASNTTGTHTTGTHTTGTHTTGTHTSETANRADPRVGHGLDSSRTDQHGAYNSSTTGAYGSSNTAGPHNSNVANKLDPRVDSDRDGSRLAGNTGTTGYGSSNTGTTGYGSSNTGTTGYGSSNTGSTGYDSNTGTYGSSNTAGPHNSNVANKLDPRVDSDRDGSRTAGNTGAYGSTGTGIGAGQSGYSTGYGNTTAGPHDSNLANKMDPRVDSDRDGSRTSGNTGAYGTTGTSGITGSHGTSTTGAYGSNTTGPHNSNIANKLDPRVDSDGSGAHFHSLGQTGRYDSYTSGTTTGTHDSHGILGSGTHSSSTTDNYGSTTHTGSNTTGSNTTTGPHNSSLLNKLDPRVDSDRDGSRMS